MKLFLLSFKKLNLIFVLLISYSTIVSAQTIRGTISDSKTGESLIGATVHIEKGDINFSTAVKLDGVYLFKNVPAGTYKLQVKYVGYKTTNEYTVEAIPNKTTLLNIAMVDNSTSLNEVSVTEHVSRETDNSARDVEKNASNTMNVVSANSIAISPDRADALK